jgi:hypothetical protein
MNIWEKTLTLGTLLEHKTFNDTSFWKDNRGRLDELAKNNKLRMRLGANFEIVGPQDC